MLCQPQLRLNDEPLVTAAAGQLHHLRPFFPGCSQWRFVVCVEQADHGFAGSTSLRIVIVQNLRCIWCNQGRFFASTPSPGGDHRSIVPAAKGRLSALQRLLAGKKDVT